MIRCCLAATLLATIAGAESLHAQDTTRAAGSPWVIATSVGLPGYEDEFAPPSFLTVAVQATYVRRGRIGPDLSVGIVPRALADGMLLAGARFGVAWAAPLSRSVFVLPSGGLSLIGATGEAGTGGALGVHAGLAAIVLGNRSSGFRIGITQHRFGDLRGSLWLLEVGLASGGVS